MFHKGRDHALTLSALHDSALCGLLEPDTALRGLLLAFLLLHAFLIQCCMPFLFSAARSGAAWRQQQLAKP